MKPVLLIAGTLATAAVLGYGTHAIESYRVAAFDRMQVEHRVYPLSVVAGGVYQEAELLAARRDPVVAAHYAGLGRMVRMDRLGGSYYDSYRIGNHIYWTTYRVHVASDELVWHETDGYGIIRPRCGNRLSLTPMQPTLSANLEPTPEQLNDILPTAPVNYEIIPYTPGTLLGDLAPQSGIDVQRGAYAAPYAPMPGYVFGSPIAERADDVAVAPATVPEPNVAGLILAGFGVLLIALVLARGR